MFSFPSVRSVALTAFTLCVSTLPPIRAGETLIPSVEEQAGKKTSRSAPANRHWGGTKHLKSSKRPKRSKPRHAPYSIITPEEDLEMVPATKDPLEKVNRGIFAFNHQFYRFIAKPIAKVTTTLIPDPVLNAVGNVFENLKSPVRISASLLQGKVGRAGKETAKLLVNSTVGLGGVWKASDKVVALRDVPEEDFGQTFGTWGIPAGPYLVVPILGPRSLRDVAGEAVDTCATPQTWLHARDVRMWAEVADNIQLNPERMHIYDSSTKDALDPYIAVREAYTNYRTHAVSK